MTSSVPKRGEAVLDTKCAMGLSYDAKCPPASQAAAAPSAVAIASQLLGVCKFKFLNMPAADYHCCALSRPGTQFPKPGTNRMSWLKEGLARCAELTASTGPSSCEVLQDLQKAEFT